MPTVIPESCAKVPENMPLRNHVCSCFLGRRCTATHSAGPVALKERKKKKKTLLFRAVLGSQQN